MDIIKAEEVIVGQWEQFFGHRGLVKDAYSTDLGLRFEVEIDVRNFGFEQDGNTHHDAWRREFLAVLEIVITARHEVFVRRHSDLVARSKDAGEWLNTSNHDSCWREDGLRPIWEALVEGHKHCWSHMPAQHSKSMNEMTRDCNVNGGPFSKGAIQFVRVKTEAGEGGRRRRIVHVKPVGFSVNIED